MDTTINSKNIPIEYRVQLQGSKNHRQSPYNIVEDIIGFADSQWGRMVVWKCRECGQIQFFHLRENENRGTFDYVRMYHEYKTTGKYKY